MTGGLGTTVADKKGLRSRHIQDKAVEASLWNDALQRKDSDRGGGRHLWDPRARPDGARGLSQSLRCVMASLFASLKLSLRLTSLSLRFTSLSLHASL